MIWNPNWRQEGRDPDYRFTLANERTFLAWVRTAMALLASGVVLEQFADRLQPHAVVIALAATTAALAGMLCLMAYRQWRAYEVAMRHDRPLPAPLALPVLGAGVMLAAAVLAALIASK